MHRNLQLLALSGLLATGLLVVWKGMSGSCGASAAGTVEDCRERAPVTEESGFGLDREPADHAPERRPAYVPVASEARQPQVVPQLVSGVVEDDRRRPVRDALVLITERGAEDAPDHPLPILAAGRSDEQGRFEIRTIVRPLQIEARASKNGLVESEPVLFSRGAENLRLVMHSTGVVTGRLLLDPGVPPSAVAVTLRTESAEPADRGDPLRLRRERGWERSSPLPVASDGSFVATGLGSRTVDITVSAAHDPWITRRVEDVRVQDSGVQTDARLDPLDLRGAFETLGIEVLDDSGGRLSGARVVLRMPGLAAPERAAFTADGRAEFFTQSGPHDIDVEMKGWRRAHLASVRGDQVVRLSKGMQVLVRVGGHAVRPPPPDHLAVGLVIGTRDHPILDGVATLSDPQQALLFVGSPGRHEVAWYLDRGSVQAYLGGCPTAFVEIRDQPGIQEIVVDLPREVEAAWLAKARELKRSRAHDEPSEGLWADFAAPVK